MPGRVTRTSAARAASSLTGRAALIALGALGVLAVLIAAQPVARFVDGLFAGTIEDESALDDPYPNE